MGKSADDFDEFLALEQIAATIRYVSWGLITALSIGGFALLYFFTEFLRGLK